jgi:predicted nucleotide-binding protein
MQKEKQYEWTKFTPEVVKNAFAAWLKYGGPQKNDWFEQSYRVTVGKETWTFDNESEFFAGYAQKCDSVLVHLQSARGTLLMRFQTVFGSSSSDITVKLANRAEIESVFAVLEEGLAKSAIPRPKVVSAHEPWETKVRIFIGHGQNPSWRELKDHLQDKQRLAVEAYETDARAGGSISDVLGLMMRRATFAVLVLTGEVLDVDGKLHARDNVIHELGLFQGRLGFNRAIPLVEDGVAEFSNLHGVQQIRFAKGGIKETFGEVLAVIKKEFSSAPGSAAVPAGGREQ